MDFQEMFSNHLVFYVQQYIDGGVRLCNQHSLHHTDHMKRNIQHIVDLWLEAWYLAPISCWQIPLIHFAPKVPDLPIFRAFPRCTKLILVWGLFYQQLVLTINWSNGRGKPKPLSVNEYTITDAIHFLEEIRNLPIHEDDILVSYNVKALFINVMLIESINILVHKLLPMTGSTNLITSKSPLLNQFFQFNGKLYEQIDGLAMGLPLSVLMANVFLCHLEDKLTNDEVMPTLYRSMLMTPWPSQNAQHRCCSWFSVYF